MTADRFSLSDSDFSFIGSGLERPECVLAGASGALYASHAAGGVIRIAPDGSRILIGRIDGEPGRFKTNGFTLRKDGSIVFANVGTEGGLWHIATDGELTPFLTEVDGIVLRAVNFVWQDSGERLWFCVSTFRERNLPYDRQDADGLIGLIDRKGARIVADGIAFTNELRLNAAGDALFVNQTFSSNTLRFDVSPDGSLGNRSIFAEYATGTYPDGMAIDVEGGIWIVSVVSNRIYRVAPDGRPSLLYEDCEQAHREDVFRRLAAGQLRAELVYQPHSRVLTNISSLAFGGPDLRTVYLGCISGDRIATFRSPVAGAIQSHWAWS